MAKSYVKYTYRDMTGRVRERFKRNNPTSLKGAGAYVRGLGQRSIHKVNRAKKHKTIYVTRQGRGGGTFLKPVRVTIRSDASLPGTPPHTRAGLLKSAILYEVGSVSVVVGPTANRIGDVGRVHEFGGQRNRPPTYRQNMGGGKYITRRDVRRKKPIYPKRPFMGPALEKSLPQLSAFWAKTVTE